MSMQKVMRAGAILAAFAVGGAALVSFSYRSTAAQIEENRRMVLLRGLQEIIPAERYDNDFLQDTRQFYDRNLGETALTVYRARKQGQAVAAAFMPTAADGYSGNIKLLVGIYQDGTLAGVRVLEHHETPGLGDAIEAERSTWIHSFTGKSLSDPLPEYWKVKKYGGVFDQFTGATITPRAVVKAVQLSLQAYDVQRTQIWAE